MTTNIVLGTPLLMEADDSHAVIYLASGCFWGAEKLMWELGATATAVGYMGGTTPSPSYRMVCTGATGHAETVRVVYNPATLPLEDILAAFWESHDPTSLDRQGNDIGSQYRSAIFWTTPEQREEAARTLAVYQAALDADDPVHAGRIVTEINEAAGPDQPGRFWLAEDYHQQYLAKNPNGYQCHSSTGVLYPRSKER